MPPTIRFSSRRGVGLRGVRGSSRDVHLGDDGALRRRTDVASPAIRYRRGVKWIERQVERVRSLNPVTVDVVLSVFFTVLGVVTVYGQDIRDDVGEIEKGLHTSMLFI